MPQTATLNCFHTANWMLTGHAMDAYESMDSAFAFQASLAFGAQRGVSAAYWSDQEDRPLP
ncbi:hypothetical protein CVT25_006394 [Psilocybe cyanescens]|uniref:Uncharacterized protein n=1 Tax=Psilocybe cyanescens TaxID=93625 RepID=A0A409X3R4_PSICY|nr:hypothetical protein CVT25_006394 [Psilocybe cyanescens]